jgi:hypothetical protein
MFNENKHGYAMPECRQNPLSGRMAQAGFFLSQNVASGRGFPQRDSPKTMDKKN